MNTKIDPPDEAELLLPWHATGRLTAAETGRLDARLSADPELVRRLALVAEERDGEVRFSEALPGPPESARAALFARIGAIEAQHADARRAPVRVRAAPRLADRVAAFVAGLAPRTVGFAAAAAALVIVVQGGVIVGDRLTPQARYTTASGPGSTAVTEGTFVLAAFAPEATAAHIGALLQERGAAIVDGPRPGGLYRLRLAPTRLPQADLDAAVTDLRGRADVVRLVLPAGS